MIPKTTCMALDIRAVLDRPMSSLQGFTDPDGRALTPRQAKTALLDQLAAGNEILSISSTPKQISSTKDHL